MLGADRKKHALIAHVHNNINRSSPTCSDDRVFPWITKGRPFGRPFVRVQANKMPRSLRGLGTEATGVESSPDVKGIEHGNMNFSTLLTYTIDLLSLEVSTLYTVTMLLCGLHWSRLAN